MEQLLDAKASEEGSEKVSRGWMRPSAWLRNQRLSRGFWVIFAIAFFFDFGILIYVFMFNLYLLDLHFNDRAIGLVNGAAMLGSIAGTLPAGALARRIGLRSMMMVCLVSAPALCAVRAMAVGQSVHIVMGFLAGLALCSWGVCFLPAVAQTTTAENRASGFSLIFSASVGTGVLGGFLCGYLPGWLAAAGIAMHPVEVKRLILLASCGIAAMGLLPMLRMRRWLPDRAPIGDPIQERSWRRFMAVDPFLRRFLPPMALWTVVLTSFAPFANVYFSRNLHIPLLRIGMIFSVAQIIQLFATLLTPLLFRWIGLVNGIVATQVLTAVALGCLAATQNAQLAVPIYLAFFGMQWMSSPGMYNILLSSVRAENQSAASSMTLFCNSLVGAISTAAAGILFTRFGYPHMLVGIAVLAVVAATVFWSLVGSKDSHGLAPQLVS